jgi:hypothetical protein
MKKSDFENFIRKIVSEEVRKQLPSVISEAFQSMVNEKPIIEPQLKKPSIQKGATTPKPFKQYTKNPILNQILNETTNDLKARDHMSGPSVGLLESMDKIMANDDAVVTGDMRELMSESVGSPTSVLDVKQHLPEPVKNALTRDYRKFMKAVDSKKKGGISNPSVAGLG